MSGHWTSTKDGRLMEEVWNRNARRDDARVAPRTRRGTKASFEFLRIARPTARSSTSPSPRQPPTPSRSSSWMENARSSRTRNTIPETHHLLARRREVCTRVEGNGDGAEQYGARRRSDPDGAPAPEYTCGSDPDHTLTRADRIIVAFDRASFRSLRIPVPCSTYATARPPLFTSRFLEGHDAIAADGDGDAGHHAVLSIGGDGRNTRAGTIADAHQACGRSS